MLINGSGAKPMDAFCSFPKQSPSRAEVLLSFSVIGLCSERAWSIAMPSFPAAWNMRYESVLFPSVPRYGIAKSDGYIHLPCGNCTALCHQGSCT